MDQSQSFVCSIDETEKETPAAELVTREHVANPICGWRPHQAGFRQLHIILKLADGTWLIGDQNDSASLDWREREFNIADIHWRKLNIATVVEGDWEQRPNLGRVDEIGWTDLMAGGGSVACSRVDWIEVYGKPVKRR